MVSNSVHATRTSVILIHIATVCENLMFLHSSPDALHLQEAIHVILAFWQLHHFVLHPVEQVQLMSSSQAFGTGGSEHSSGINRDVASMFQPIVSGGGKTGCCK